MLKQAITKHFQDLSIAILIIALTGIWKSIFKSVMVIVPIILQPTWTETKEKWRILHIAERN